MKKQKLLTLQTPSKRYCSLFTFLALAGGLLSVQSCSTVEGTSGRCKAYKDPKYVASVRDTDGKDWQIQVTPDIADLQCDKESVVGVIRFTAIVLDGQGFAKPALAVNSDFVGASVTQNGGSGFERNPGGAEPDKYTPDDVATDSCGTAQFSIKFTCPGARKTVGGLFYVTSGPLRSKPVKVTLEHSVQPETTVVNQPNPNPGNLNPGTPKQ